MTATEHDPTYEDPNAFEDHDTVDSTTIKTAPDDFDDKAVDDNAEGGD